MKRIPLTQGYVALVSDKDYARVKAAGPWHAQTVKDKNGNIRKVYAVHGVPRGSKGGRAVYMHRFVLGVTDPKTEIDHYPDSSGLNNQRKNLRTASPKENMRNKTTTTANTSGYKGVSWSSGKRKWKTTILRMFLGYFDSKKEAAKTYDKAAKKLFGKFAVTNF